MSKYVQPKEELEPEVVLESQEFIYLFIYLFID